MGDELDLLEQEYCPPLDPALVHALYPDYPDIQVLRELLDGIKQQAIAEQLTEFDASGSSGPGLNSSDEILSNAESWASQTTVTDHTGVGTRSGSSETENEDRDCFRETEQLDTPTKELLLAETFPTLRHDLVVYTLKKCNNDFSQATDELLNHVYFEDTRDSPTEEAAPRGIDAFSEDYHIPKRGKKNRKKNKKGGFIDASVASESDVSRTNKWNDGGKDIEFIASRTRLGTKAIASLYHKNGASLSAAILTVIRDDMMSYAKEEPHASLIQPAIDLTTEFPNIDLHYAIALVRLTEPSTVHAHDLAKALTVYPETRTLSTVDLKIVPRYAPLNLSDSTPESSKLPTLPPSVTAYTTASLTATRGSAFTQASAAYRKGRSDPLMRAAAGYYSQVGRDADANLRAAKKADADQIAAQQSTATSLDLHYIDVQNATRIAKQRTRAWWDGLGEQRIPGGGRSGVGEGYRIITGLGRHSVDGRGKLGPAVYLALVGEGWKVQVDSGQMFVVGRR